MGLKRVIVKNMSAAKVQAFIRRRSACWSATEWQKGKDLRTIWRTCPNPGWLLWFIFEMAVDGEPAEHAKWGGDDNFYKFRNVYWDLDLRNSNPKVLLTFIKRHYQVEAKRVKAKK